MITLPDLPLPPSVNSIYRNVRGKGRVYSKQAKSFHKKIYDWAILNSQELIPYRAWLDKEIKTGKVFYFQHLILLPTERIFLNGNMLENDPTNRVKILDDALAKVLWMPSDTWIKKETVELIKFRPGAVPYVKTHIQSYVLKSWYDMKELA